MRPPAKRNAARGLLSNLCVLSLKLIVVLISFLAVCSFVWFVYEIMVERQIVLDRDRETRWTHAGQCSNPAELNKNLVQAQSCSKYLAYINMIERDGAWGHGIANLLERYGFCGGIGCATYLKDSIWWLGVYAIVLMVAVIFVLRALYFLVEQLNIWNHQADLRRYAGMIGGPDADQPATRMLPAPKQD